MRPPPAYEVSQLHGTENVSRNNELMEIALVTMNLRQSPQNSSLFLPIIIATFYCKKSV